MVDLPPDLLAHIVLSLADDDFHMLTLPLTCSLFRRLFLSGEPAAARLASRLRQVEAAVCQPGLSVDGSNEWALAHACGALRDTDALLCSENISLYALAAVPRGLSSLRALVVHCCGTTPAPTPPAAAMTAEALFIEAEAKRMQQPSGRHRPCDRAGAPSPP